MKNRIGPSEDPATPPQSDLLKIATQYRDLGFSLFPIRTDGSKAPAVRRWKHLQRRLPTDAELRARFGQTKRYGIAIIGGAISGNLERLDFDEIGLYETWHALCTEQGLAELLPRMVVVQTPSGGYHCYYRCTEPVPGNLYLARRQVSVKKIVTLAETRGEGGYTLAPGSPIECHKDRKPYVLVQGKFAHVPVFTRSERDALVRLVEVFNEYIGPELLTPRPPSPTATLPEGRANPIGSFPEPCAKLASPALPVASRAKRASESSGGEERSGGVGRPGDDFNLSGEIAPILLAAGWAVCGRRGEMTFWRRPGKVGPGLSATENYAGRRLFHIFSSNAYPFAPNRSYPPFHVKALLEHNGDFSAAAQALALEGYGEPTPPLWGTPPASGGGRELGISLTGPPPPEAGGERRSLGVGLSDGYDGGVDADDIEEESESAPMLCGPYLAPASSHLLFGTRGIGKSTLVFGLAAAVARGEPWHGIECVQANVIYMDLESGTTLRAVKLRRLYSPRFGKRECLIFFDRRFRFPEELPQLLEIVQRRKTGLVVFDTLRRCFAVRDENDNAEFYHRVAPVIDALKSVGVASLVIAHPPKGIGNSARGAGAQEDAVDVVMSLTMHSGLVTDANGTLSLTVHKHRALGLSIPPLHLRRLGEDRFERVEIEDSRARSAQPTKIRLCERAIVRLLRESEPDPVPCGALYSRLNDSSISMATFRLALSRMKKQGALVLTGSGYAAPDPFGPDNEYYDALHSEAFPSSDDDFDS